MTAAAARSGSTFSLVRNARGVLRRVPVWAPRFHMGHVLEDANAALAWVDTNISAYGGDPQRLVLGGDSASGHIAALLTALDRPV
ncbi:alpha/beta hydrolase [Pseudarthrobacter siccitolerans]